jgi:hypothetical protein
LTTSNLLRGVNIPDICPSDVLGGGGEFSLAAGDFGEIYSGDEEKGKWAGVVTCFFIDCVCLPSSAIPHSSVGVYSASLSLAHPILSEGYQRGE